MLSTRYTCRILIKLEFSRQIFEKVSNIKFNQNSFSGSRVISCEQINERTDMTKLMVAFCNFGQANKNCTFGQQGSFIRFVYILQQTANSALYNTK